MSPLTRFLALKRQATLLNVLVILSMLLAPLPLREAQAAPQTAGASLAPLPGQPEAAGALNDPLPGPDPRRVFVGQEGVQRQDSRQPAVDRGRLETLLALLQNELVYVAEGDRAGRAIAGDSRKLA